MYLSQSIIRHGSLVAVGIFFIFSYTTVHAQAQTGQNGRCADGVCVESLSVVQTTDVSTDDGDCDDSEREVTSGACDDEVSVEKATIISGGDIEETDSIAPAQDYNSSRSNKPSSIRDGGGDIDDDEDRIAPAQDYNAARSNRPSSIRDATDDQTAPYLWQSLQLVGGVGSEDLDNDDDGVSDGEGSNSTNTARIFLKFDDIKGEVRVEEETGIIRLSQVAVAARDVRNWTEEDREAFTALRQAVASNTPEAASLRITQQLLDDDQIEEIEVNETESRVRYRASLRLFGFIPLEREVEATAQVNGEVVVNYPWYSFFATKPDTQRIRVALVDSRNSIVVAPDRAE
jgi:hypothetical protein